MGKQCTFFLEKKQRCCRHPAGAKHDLFCPVHAPAPREAPCGAAWTGQVPCPLDPTHSVGAKRLRRHLRVCPSRGTEPHPPESPPAPTTAEHVEILFQANYVCIVHKPHGLLCTPGATADRADCVEYRMRQALAPSVTSLPKRMCVHRLDMDTSGCLVLALTAATHRELSEKFASRDVDKQYVAVVHGHMAADKGVVTARIGRDEASQRVRRRVVAPGSGGQEAETHFTVVERLEGDARFCDADGQPLPCTRVRLSPHTGRTHQLRVHMAHLGHPILGDDLYERPDQRASCPRLLLHACSVAFQLGGQPVAVTCASAF